jgi:hypothetical protein
MSSVVLKGGSCDIGVTEDRNDGSCNDGLVMLAY